MTKDDFRGVTSEGAVYGYRGLTELSLHKDFFLHAEYERLNTLISDSIFMQVLKNVLEKEWVDGLLVGVGKEYKIWGLVKGNMQLLYNFLHTPNSPYQEKVMVQFDLSFGLKDKSTPERPGPTIKGKSEKEICKKLKVLK